MEKPDTRLIDSMLACTLALQNANRVLASYERILREQGNVSQADGVQGHRAIVCEALRAANDAITRHSPDGRCEGIEHGTTGYGLRNTIRRCRLSAGHNDTHLFGGAVGSRGITRKDHP